jgi:hypothetical protein
MKFLKPIRLLGEDFEGILFYRQANDQTNPKGC